MVVSFFPFALFTVIVGVIVGVLDVAAMFLTDVVASLSVQCVSVCACVCVRVCVNAYVFVCTCRVLVYKNNNNNNEAKRP
jgi:hypothetical protein